MIIQKERRKVTGFTLVELVITIAIVIILSVISVPIYRAYVDKAKLAEGYALLGALSSAQKAYYSEYGNFYWTGTTATNYDPVLGIDARGNKYFTWFRAGSSNTGANIKNLIQTAVFKPEELKRSGGKPVQGIGSDVGLTRRTVFDFEW